MLQLNSVANVGVHRTCTPLYEKYEATPYNTFLDPTETGNIYSGMVVYRTGADTVALFDGNTATANSTIALTGPKPFGLAAFDRNPNIDDLSQVGLNSVSVWLGGENAFFTIGAPAFDTTQTYTVPTNGARQYLFAGTGSAKGMLTSAIPVATYATPVAELIDVLGATQIVVRLMPAAGTTSL
jgi:hypothetical protein